MDEFKEKDSLEAIPEEETVSGGDAPAEEATEEAENKIEEQAESEEQTAAEEQTEIEDGILITPEEEVEKAPDEEEMCLLCGEKPADKSFGENYDLCADCRKSLIKSPLRFSGFLAVVALFCAGLWGMMFSVNQYSTLTAVIQGDDYLATNNLNRAISSYSSASNVGFKTARKIVDTANKSGYLSAINSAVSTYFYDASDLEEGEKLSFADKAGKANLNAFWNRKTKAISEDYNAAMDAYEKYYAYLSQYDEQLYYGTVTAEEVPYDDIFEQYEAAKQDNESVEELAFINYCEYYLAIICDKGVDAQYAALVETARVAPEFDWLYLTPLAEMNVRLGNYDEAEENCAALEAKNADDLYGEYYRAQIYRMKGEYDKALAIAEEMVADYDESGFYYAFYEAAIDCFLMGDYEKALSYNTTCYDGEYLNEMTANLQALLYKLGGDEDGYDEVVSMLAGYDIEISPTVQEYLDGKITAEEMFNEREVPFE